jgi:hypothetical protein
LKIGHGAAYAPSVRWRYLDNEIMKTLMKFLLPTLFAIILASSLENAQTTEQQSITYIDTTYGYSVRIPNWFTVTQSKEYTEAIDVLESGSFSFRIFRSNMVVGNEVLQSAMGATYDDSSDVFLEAVKEKAFSSVCLNYHGTEVIGRIDSLKEYRSSRGLRIIGAYRTKYYQPIGPLYIVDISGIAKGKFAVFDFSWFNPADSVYSRLALSIALSAQPMRGYISR